MYNNIPLFLTAELLTGVLILKPGTLTGDSYFSRSFLILSYCVFALNALMICFCSFCRNFILTSINITIISLLSHDLEKTFFKKTSQHYTQS